MRSSRPLLLSFSRMLDMGGMPSAASAKAIKPVNAAKNCKVQCLAFDFDLLTRTVNESSAKPVKITAPPVDPVRLDPVVPNVGMIQEMANLLNVSLGGSKAKKDDDAADDLSALLSAEEEAAVLEKAAADKKINKNPLAGSDIRNKYASKLRHRVEGGVAGLESAKQRQADALVKGDAAGHLAARTVAMNQGNTETKWMAMTGTGTLLQYISNRSMKIALLPVPSNSHAEIEGKRMREFAKQLPNVEFNVVLQNGEAASDVLTNLLEELSTLDPPTTMVVSDRDDYLRFAKDSGMTTCRVRTHANAPRGNVSAHYSVNSMAEVQDVLDEINGISFNAVFASK